MELELKHIAPYLPYGLEMAYRSHKTGIYEPRGKLVGITNHSFETHPVRLLIEGMDFEHIWMFKPILRPMSIIELTNYFLLLFDEDIDVRTFLNDEFLESHGIDFEKILDFKIEWLPFGVVDLFLKHHFDVFGLIPQGLAVDANSLKSENQ